MVDPQQYQQVLGVLSTNPEYQALSAEEKGLRLNLRIRGQEFMAKVKNYRDNPMESINTIFRLAMLQDEICVAKLKLEILVAVNIGLHEIANELADRLIEIIDGPQDIFEEE